MGGRGKNGTGESHEYREAREKNKGHTEITRRPGGERGWMVGLRIDEWTRQEKYFRYEIIFLCLLSIIIYTDRRNATK